MIAESTYQGILGIWPRVWVLKDSKTCAKFPDGLILGDLLRALLRLDPGLLFCGLSHDRSGRAGSLVLGASGNHGKMGG